MVSVQASELQSTSIIAMFSKPVKMQKSDIKSCYFVESIIEILKSMYILNKFRHIFTKKTIGIIDGQKEDPLGCGVMLAISKPSPNFRCLNQTSNLGQ